MNYTKGEWKANKSSIECDGWPVAQTYPDTRLNSNASLSLMRANAHLIAAAVNACASVNPDNPMAVAESIKDMYEALGELLEITHDLTLGDGSPDPQVEAANRKGREALAKAEGAK